MGPKQSGNVKGSAKTGIFVNSHWGKDLFAGLQMEWKTGSSLTKFYDRSTSSEVLFVSEKETPVREFRRRSRAYLTAEFFVTLTGVYKQDQTAFAGEYNFSA